MNRASILAALLLALSVAAHAAPLGNEIGVGYVQIADDPRYDDKEGPAETTMTRGRPVVGAQMAIDEVNIDAAATGRTFKLIEQDAAERRRVAPPRSTPWRRAACIGS